MAPSAADPGSAWPAQWAAHVADIRDDCEPRESAERLRRLIKSKLLLFTDMQTDPRKFFLAHRMLVDPKTRGPGFWIRFTVQYNLFAGTVLGLGGPEHVAKLAEMQSKGQLGCFGLTEKLAGVNSGLVVNTTATWVPEAQRFVLHSPNEGAYKNWISQGFHADFCAVIADLRVAGKSHGPHAFLMALRDESGRVARGVTLIDMGRKSIANSLDNVAIGFDRVELPRSALLNRFADVENDAYVQKTAERMRIEIIGQRLLTGRVAVAQAALEFCSKLVALTRAYAERKQCWSPGGTVALITIPHIHAVFADADARLAHMSEYMAHVESKLSESLVRAAIPDARTVEAIAVGKVSAVETAIDLSFRLKQEVGSYALMGGAGFENMGAAQGSWRAAAPAARATDATSTRLFAVLQVRGGRLARADAEARARPVPRVPGQRQVGDDPRS